MGRKIIETGNRYGSMNTGTIKLSNMTEQDKKLIMQINNLKTLEGYELKKTDKSAIFKEHRQQLGADYGFDWGKMFMADQIHKSGTYFTIDKEYVETNPNGWTDIPEDILMIKKETPGIVIGHPVADCPVIIMTDIKQGITAIAHCSAELIDKKMPMMIADALLDAYQTKDENIFTYVSSCAGSDWTYDKYPNWATDQKMWESGIEKDKNGIFHINLRNIIDNQLRERKIETGKIKYNEVDTIYDPNYYSNCASSSYGLNQPEKYGRNFVGAYYEESKVKVKK